MSNTLSEALAKNLAKITKDFTKAKHKNAERPLSQRDLAWLRAEEKREERELLKTAAWKVMPQAYALASDNGRLPANARQVMYAARPLVLGLTNGKCWKNSQYFTQHLLVDYLEEHPDETADWDIVFDARGHLYEPHGDFQIGLGTLEVREYIGQCEASTEDKLNQVKIESRWPTVGPTSRYKYALFIEKEGFGPLLAQRRIRERYDMMTFSTKGMSVTSARRLVEELSLRGVTIFVAHDFDINGLTICHTLSHDTRRYQFKTAPNVIDLGLRLADIRAMDLQSEPVEINQRKDPREKFRYGDGNYSFAGDYDVTNEELAFLVGRHEHNGYSHFWRGQRVELNAMTSAQFIAWLEQKFAEYEVEKVIPDEETVGLAWCRARRIAQANKAIAELLEKLNKEEGEPPSDLMERIQGQLIVGNPESWDQVLMEIVEDDIQRES